MVISSEAYAAYVHLMNQHTNVQRLTKPSQTLSR